MIESIETRPDADRGVVVTYVTGVEGAHPRGIAVQYAYDLGKRLAKRPEYVSLAPFEFASIAHTAACNTYINGIKVVAYPFPLYGYFAAAFGHGFGVGLAEQLLPAVYPV